MSQKGREEGTPACALLAPSHPQDARSPGCFHNKTSFLLPGQNLGALLGEIVVAGRCSENSEKQAFMKHKIISPINPTSGGDNEALCLVRFSKGLSTFDYTLLSEKKVILMSS